MEYEIELGLYGGMYCVIQYVVLANRGVQFDRVPYASWGYGALKEARAKIKELNEEIKDEQQRSDEGFTRRDRRI